MCNVQTGTCICKTGYMDADDDRYNGCETKVYHKSFTDTILDFSFRVVTKLP